MNTMNGASDSGPSSSGLASVPVVLATLLVLFLGVDYAANGAMGNDGYARILILPAVAALAAALGRIGAVASLGKLSKYRVAVVSVGFVATAAVISMAYNLFESVGNIGAFTFAFVGIATLLLVLSGRREESTILLATVLGFHFGVTHAANSVMDLSTWTGNATDLIDVERAAAASVFFAFWAVSIVAGAMTALLLRKKLDPTGTGSWFEGLRDTPSRGLMIVFGLILVVQAIPLVWLGQISDIETFSQHRYLGSVWALFATVAILFVAFCHAERWHVIGALVAVNWILYTFGHLHEIGNEFPDLLNGDDLMGTLSWLFIAFWLNVAGIMLASRGYFGDIAPRYEPSEPRKWWGRHSYGIMLGLAVFVGLAVRIGWNVLPAMNATGTGLWDMTGGSDPWYMKRVVDYIIAERSHFIFDHDRAYPMGAINPRPPLFSWSLALGGLGLSWLLEMPADEAVWWSVAAFPAIFGALIVLPLAAIARRIHSNTAGIVTAWLIALMPGHISHSTFGLADHDAFALLFLSLAFYFWVRAIDGLGTERMFSRTSSNPLYLLAGMRESWRRNPSTMAYATLSGISFATVALGWKGFVYGPGILFLAFAGQIVLNMFRRRDSLPLTSAALQMLLTTFVIPLPFYSWPGLNLLFDPSGFQPMFYILGFTLALGWVSSSFRDKPWLLALGGGTLLIGAILAILFVLQELEIYNGWDILFTGGFYFSKNKIFATIGEAQAPSRGVLFASYGPIVALIAVGCAILLMWRGARRERQSSLLLGLWVLIATYMAWSAGRFIFNATPAMAVVGGLGIAMMWKSADFTGFAKEWRRSGIGTPRTRLKSVWPATKKHSAVPALLLVLLLLASQHTTYGIDSGIPRGQASATDVDQVIHDIAPDIMRLEALGLSILNSADYNPESGQLWYMGTFGPGFNSGSWNLAYDWLSKQDADVGFSQRPAFVSWWDYGFQALAAGQHPTVADNFQSGIPNSGGMLLSKGQEDTVAMFIATLSQGDRRYNDGGGFTDEFAASLSTIMDEGQLEEYDSILSIRVGDEGFVLGRSMAVMATDNEVELLHGHQLDSNGIPGDEEWVVMIGGTQMGNSTTNETEALELFNATRLKSSPFDMEATHYVIGGYRYTSDLIDDFNDVSTGLHRSNARLALSRAFLITAFDMSELADIYHGITNLEYDVQNYEGSLGETITRNNDIRYFAIDNRLYPLGGAYYADYEYHRGQTTGIFHAPTGLAGLDMKDYITSVYDTQRGDGPIIPRTAQEYEQEYLNDITRNQYTQQNDQSAIIRLVDIDYQQQPAFFETMVARFYVGYGTSTLGLPGNAEQPAPHFYTTGTPGSYLESAMPLPGAMMNHFVISNWYDSERCELLENGSKVDQNCSNPTIGSANTQVKIMKYYSGATLEGTVELDGFGPVPNARVMIERDAFSGEENADENGHVADGDDRTYWIPIGVTDADENGHFSFTVPAGKLRVSAFIGEPNLDAARSFIMTADVGQSLNDIFEQTSTNRAVNPITGILANVSGSTWLSETIINVSGSAGHSNGEEIVYGNLSVAPSHATGKLIWSGAEFFDGDPLTNVSIEISPSWDQVQLEPYTVDTSSGVVEGYDLSFQGIGQVTFTGEGTVRSLGIVTVSDFTGNYTQTVFHNHSLTGDGQFSGSGTLSGTVSDDVEIGSCDYGIDSMPIQNGGSGYNNSTVVSFEGGSGSGATAEVVLTNDSISDIIITNGGTGYLSTDAEEITVSFGNTSGTGASTANATLTDAFVPVNSSVCLLEGGDYLLQGTMNATGRYTSDGSSSFIRTLSHSTLVGSGVFTVDTTEELDSYGTINGTFSSASGEGIFSGPMVHPGTFHIVDAVPGKYDLTVIFEDGVRIELDDGFSIPLVGSPEVSTVDIAGGSITGLLVNTSGEPLGGAVMLLDNESEPSDAILDCYEVGTAPCLIVPDEDGAFEFGPIIPGNYTAQIDLDDDGFPELSRDYVFDSEFDSAYEFPSPVPETSDLTFRLLHDGANVPDLNVTLHLKNGTGEPITAQFDNESDIYMVELVHGTWIMNHTLSEELQVWEQIEIDDEDITADYEFHISHLIVGNVYYEEDLESQLVGPDEGKILDYVAVEFHWGDFSIISETNGSGGFSVVLPEGAEVDATVQLHGAQLNMVNGTRFTVTEDGPVVGSELVDNITMIARPGYAVEGQVNINRLDNPYHSSYGGWEPVTVTADNIDTDVRWRGQVAPTGQFQMVLPEGNWTFDLDAEWLSPMPVDLNVDGKNDTLDIMVYPVNSSVRIDFFLDHSGDNNASNGTAVTYDFRIVNSLNSTDVLYEVLANGSEWVSEGVAELSLEPGAYRIDIESSDADAGDPFGTRIMTGYTGFVVGLRGNSVERSIGFDPEWRINITFSNESGGPLAEQLVRLTNVESGWMISHFTDSEGMWTAHVPAGEWIVTIDAFEISPGVEEILRDLISVSADTASDDISMSTSEVARFSITLYEDYSEGALEGISLDLVSGDGLGLVHLDSTDSSGQVPISVAPGIWNIEFNLTEDRLRWAVESTNESAFELVAGDNPDVNVTATKLIEIGSNVFWDFDDDNRSDVGEGVSNVTIHLSSEDSNLTAVTDNSGDWRVFVPAGSFWELHTEIAGFADVHNLLQMVVDPAWTDIELTAGTVEVKGNVSYINEQQFSLISDSIILNLLPVSGFERDTIVPDKMLINGSWTGGWEAQIEPGNWVLRVTSVENNLVAMALVEAGVVEGAEIDVELKVGGWLNLPTSWIDYEGDEHTLAVLETENAEIINSPDPIINIGAGLSWNSSVDEEGNLRILLPSGRIDISCTALIVQRNLTMEYEGEQGVDIRVNQETPPTTLNLVRKVNPYISSYLINNSQWNESEDFDVDITTSVPTDNGGFETVYYHLGVQYDGHETFQTYTAYPLLEGTDLPLNEGDAGWTVEVHNGSGIWGEETNISMGLDSITNFTELHVRIIPPNQSVAHYIEGGLQVTIFFKDNPVTYFHNYHDIRVKIPQLHGFELTEPMAETYGIYPGTSSGIGMKFTNSGNGDEIFAFEFDDSELPDYWERTGPITHTLGPFVHTTHTVMIRAPANASDEDFKIYVTVRDSANNTYPDVEIHIKTSRPALRIDSHQLYGGGIDLVAYQTALYYVNVTNSGLIDASLVQLNGTLCSDIYCDSPLPVNGTDIMDVPASSTVTFEIMLDLSEIDPDTYYLHFDINETGFDSVEDYSSKQVKVRSPPIEETTDWIGWLLGGLLLLALLLLTRGGGGRRRSSAPF